MSIQAPQEFTMCVPEPSPNQSPLSTSPIPEANHSPRGNLMPQEHSWNIIVEPHGNSTLVHFINPHTGAIVHSTCANYGDIIQFDHGVFFQVPPYPQPAGSVPMQTIPMQHQQPQTMYVNVSPQNLQNCNVMTNGYQPEYVDPSYCPPTSNYNHTQQNDMVQNGTIPPEKRRDKPLKAKMRDKQPSCACQPNVQYIDYNHDMAMNGKMIYRHPDGGMVFFGSVLFFFVLFCLQKNHQNYFCLSSYLNCLKCLQISSREMFSSKHYMLRNTGNFYILCTLFTTYILVKAIPLWKKGF